MQLLLYADDTVLLADNQTSLQHTLNCLADYCDDWEVDVNTEKTNISIFSKQKSRNPYQFYFNGCIVKTVDSNTLALFSFIMGHL